MKRRTLLVALGGTMFSLSGCSGSETDQTHTLDRDAVLRAVPDSQSTAETVVQYTDLPEDERNVAQRALEDSLYHACPELPEAVRSFPQQFESSKEAYLKYQDTRYALYMRITDQIYLSTASPPEKDLSC